MNKSSVYLRIPDGQVQCLLDGAAQETVDGVMRYRDQNDLNKRLANIIEAERNGDSALCINTLSDRQHPPTQENCDHIALGKAIKSMVQLPNVVPNFTCVFWHAYSNADKTAHPVVEPYQIYPTNIASNAHFGLLVWKAMALGAYSGEIQDMFPESNGVHLSSSCSEEAESVQWLSHMCIYYVYPEVANADEFYLGIPHSNHFGEE